jgi:hypothetical protein
MGEQAQHMNRPVHEISSIECGHGMPSDQYLRSFRELVGLDEDEYRDLKKRIRSNVIELNRIKALGNNGRSMRLFRKISQMNPDEIRSFKKAPENEVRND